jgi:hypothetical protein
MSYFKHLVVASILSTSLLTLSCKKDPVSNIIVSPPPPPVDPTPPFNPYFRISATDWSKIADSTYLCSFPDIFIPKYMAGKTTTVFLVVNSSVRLKVNDSGLNFFGGHLTAMSGPSDLKFFIHSNDGTLKLPPQGLLFDVSIQ